MAIPRSVRIPVTRPVANLEDPRYTVPINVIDERMLTMQDEEIMAAMAFYLPRSKFKAGDVVMLDYIPGHLRDPKYPGFKPLVPRLWKIRFVIAAWAFDLMRMAEQVGGRLSLEQARITLENAAGYHQEYDYKKPMIYAHGYPHGEYPDTAAWLPERCLRQMKLREVNEIWPAIVEEARAPYLGYDPEKHPTLYTLDLAPDDYRSGHNLERPFAAEEPLVNALHFAGFEEEMAFPLAVDPNEARRIDRPVDPEHDLFGSAEEE